MALLPAISSSESCGGLLLDDEQHNILGDFSIKHAETLDTDSGFEGSY